MAGRATLTTVPSMKARLEPRTVAASTQTRASAPHVPPSATERIAASSQGVLMEAMIRAGKHIQRSRLVGSDAEVTIEHAAARQNYQRSLRPNWIWREVVEVLVMAPAVPDWPVGLAAVGGVKTIRFGVLKFARFRRLKISARNCRLRRSRIAVSLSMEKSQAARPGPM